LLGMTAKTSEPSDIEHVILYSTQLRDKFLIEISGLIAPMSVPMWFGSGWDIGERYQIRWVLTGYLLVGLEIRRLALKQKVYFFSFCSVSRNNLSISVAIMRHVLS